MFNKLSLGAKIICGFSLLLLLLVVIAYVGFSSIQTIHGRVDTTTRVNSLSSLLTDARLAEKNYISHNREEDAELVERIVGSLVTKADELASDMGMDAAASEVGQISVMATTYRQAFSDYRRLRQKKDAARQQMAAAGKEAETAVRKIISFQEGDLEKISREASTLSEQTRANTDDAIRMHQMLLHVKGVVLASRYSSNEQLADEFTEKIDLMRTIGQLLIIRLDRQSAKDILAEIIDALDPYLQAYGAYRKKRIENNLTRLENIGAEVEAKLNQFRCDQDTDLKVVQTLVEQSIGKKTAIISGSYRIMIWFQEAASGEQAFTISHDEQSLNQVTERLDKIISLASEFKDSFTDEEQRSQIEVLLAKVDAYRGAFTSYGELTREQERAMDVMVNSAREVVSVGAMLADAEQDAMQRQTVRARMEITTFALVAIIAGILLGLLITRLITRPLKKIIDHLEIGVGQVTGASDEVASASQALAQGASRQAAAIEETSATIEESSSLTRSNADNATEADRLADKARDTMLQTSKAMEELAGSIERIGVAGQEISKVIKSIDDIAFQTNLLALNAAVEAARAGESGAGFAVVAEEVRNLARRAAEAASATQGLIEDTVRRIAEGTAVMGRVQEDFSQVNEVNEKVDNLVKEIAAASREQAKGIEQVTEAMRQIDGVTQEVASHAEESSSAAEELAAQAVAMKDVVTHLLFLLTGGGQRLEEANQDFGGYLAGPQNPHALARKQHALPAAGGTARELSSDEIILVDDEEDESDSF
ncbi:MAG: methyl-accepting chemotaxis protein [Deltaproteobacteria bacterium]|nr:methyl-accepting chemotaxis protein [Candidatus Anaeroferrophillus wilburensis]MBN2889404.1 methyl-accepting chemotaxis protein [Deltaproteobacteria bacterium]